MDELKFDEGGDSTQSVDFVYPEDEQERINAMDMCRDVLGRVIGFVYFSGSGSSIPSRRAIEMRLIAIGIILGVEKLNGIKLEDYAKKFGVTKSRASKVMNQVRTYLGVDNYGISSRQTRENCRAAALRRAKNT